MKSVPLHSSIGKHVVLNNLRGSTTKNLKGKKGIVSRFDPDIEDTTQQDYLVVDEHGKKLGWFARREFEYID